MFGAHYRSTLSSGAVLGYEIGLFAIALIANARLLPPGSPDHRRTTRSRIEPEHAIGSVRP